MKYHLVTLGCPKNAVDSEGMDGLLTEAGHTQATTADEADVIIVNTCSFIAAAREETLGVLRELASGKREGQQLIAAGCMAQSHGELVAAVPGVDQTLSTQQWMQIADLVGGTTPRTTKQGQAIPVLSLQPAPAPVAEAPPLPGYADWRTTQIRRTRSTPSAYLKISDGCNLRCAFCTIPSFKGDMASKPVGAVLAEARELVQHGVRELVLVAQHLTDYGRDLGLRDGLALLLEELCQVVPETTWIRLMYAYPHGISERLIRVMADHPQIVKYLDMPLQHAHPATLRRMRRPPDTERTMALLTTMRAAMPDLALRSTFIVGFPGETPEEFRALLMFLETMQLDRVGAFRYSQEPGTHAATLPDQVRPQVIERRWHTLMQLQQGISQQRMTRWVGRTLPVLIEGHGTGDDERPLAVGRSFRDAPEVDGQVFVWGNPPVGEFVRVQVTQATAYDLWGEVAG
ncbi:30S ribosomal protein S12 methylthiotransferase RimO [Candidatus Chloroploca asiatica]|uniref:Ribosomal protein uS12 methylthiotransferase RimO n=1 Tax=Candidatus Chloroploca asiatica TaxID=1506545 RepID=A0A2H3KUN2_9CHLR|nr:30S ribosomal protein S12 methylthiotransferase RimO [Candidatus Chloroploca asiatica]PDV99038.1 ribosomal protein S12 methylthiotransferase RimO [Candidatus Chloroploca asiatica]